MVLWDVDRPVRGEIDGPGERATLGAGRARTQERFARPIVTTYDGCARAVARAAGPGAITVRVSNEDGTGSSVFVVTAG